MDPWFGVAGVLRKSYYLVNLLFSLAFSAVDPTFSEHDSPILMHFAPRLVYLTVVGFIQNTLYLGTRTYALFLGSTLKNRRALEDTIDVWFLSSIFPISTLVCTVFWSFTLYDRCSMVPCFVQDSFLPLSGVANNIYHSYPLLLAMAEFLVSRPKVVSLGKVVRLYSLLITSYGVAFLAYGVANGWPYPFLNRMDWVQVLAFIGIVFLYGVVVVCMGAKVSELVNMSVGVEKLR